MNRITEIFGSMVFGDEVMRERLPSEAYKTMHKTIEMGKPLDINLANVVANAMKTWALEKGVTHYTHWFQPMTGITAEKHDSFLQADPNSPCKVIMSFKGKELIKGEPDASSFPSGSLRETFEARGYTAWDPSSYAFIKDNVLCIPTAFFSYGGEVLDKKTPLLLSMEALNKSAKRVLKLFGHTNIKRVSTTVGPEQEYFLIDRSVFERRPDLIYCGRTLIGSRPPKGQELEDHYFGALKPRVLAYMKELDEELWKLGIFAKTEHNEAAPAQHELAPMFTTGNIATDHNQLTMEMMKKVATRHGLVCLLHEKPFAGVNGSGKHDNWSLSTNTGINLLEPGDSPSDNAQFLLFMLAIIKAVDVHQDVLRMSVASAGNDHRLGSAEAPPAIISIFLGEELGEVFDHIESGTPYNGKGKSELVIGVDLLPNLPKDSTDRNRTSPMAFTGNKFEFRMVGSTFSVSGPNFVLNTIVADVLSEFADRLENSSDFNSDLAALIKETVINHKRIIFNGNNYSEEWIAEAARRGLLNNASTNTAVPCFCEEKNIDLFVRHGVLNRAEIFARTDILLDNYCKTINIEATTLLQMLDRDIIPAVFNYQRDISELALAKSTAFKDINIETETETVKKLSALTAELVGKKKELEDHVSKAKSFVSIRELADFSHDFMLKSMQDIRIIADDLELICSSKYWPYPTYGEILFSV